MSAPEGHHIIFIQESIMARQTQKKNASIHQFELRKRLQDAVAGGRHFVTVTTLDPASGKLDHYYVWENFPEADVIPSLAHMATQIDRER
jgi:hypothetical protein